VCIVHRCEGKEKKKGKEILCGQTREQENSLFGNYGNLEKKLKKRILCSNPPISLLLSTIIEHETINYTVLSTLTKKKSDFYYELHRTTYTKSIVKRFMFFFLLLSLSFFLINFFV